MKDLNDWIAKSFPNSPVTRELFRYSNEKFIRTVTPIFLLKCATAVSCKLGRPRISTLHIAPSRSFKSYTSSVVMKIFDEYFWINTRSDFTIHSLKKYKKELKEKKCLLVNDGTTLFASKSHRTKDRLVGGLSELIADEAYTYRDFCPENEFTLKGWVTLVMNMTSEAYKNYKDRLLGSTFSEKMLTLHHALTKSEMDAWVAKEEKSKNIHFGRRITRHDIETSVEDIPCRYFDSILRKAEEFSYLAMQGFLGCQDLIKGAMRAHASLNNRREICDDDLRFLSIVEPYLVNPFSPYEGKIAKCASQGLSCRNTCKSIGKSKNYVRQVHSVVKKARIRGIIPIEKKAGHFIRAERENFHAT